MFSFQEEFSNCQYKCSIVAIANILTTNLDVLTTSLLNWPNCARVTSQNVSLWKHQQLPSSSVHRERNSGKEILLNWKNYFLRKSTDIEFSIKSNVVRTGELPMPKRRRAIGEKLMRQNFPIILHFADNKENTNLRSLLRRKHNRNWFSNLSRRNNWISSLLNCGFDFLQFTSSRIGGESFICRLTNSRRNSADKSRFPRKSN